MSESHESDKKHPKAPTQPEAGPPERGSPEMDANAKSGTSGDDRLAALQRELDECKGKLLRSAADYQNAIRRSQLASQEARVQQLLEICKSLINVLDHFDRALEIDLTKVPAQNLIQGVQIVRDELNKLLEGFGLRRIEAKVGEEFNPARHEALLNQSVEGVPAHHIAVQLAPGYALGEKTLRPAKVSIAK